MHKCIERYCGTNGIECRQRELYSILSYHNWATTRATGKLITAVCIQYIHLYRISLSFEMCSLFNGHIVPRSNSNGTIHTNYYQRNGSLDFNFLSSENRVNHARSHLHAPIHINQEWRFASHLRQRILHILLKHTHLKYAFLAINCSHRFRACHGMNIKHSLEQS